MFKFDPKKNLNTRIAKTKSLTYNLSVSNVLQFFPNDFTGRNQDDFYLTFENHLELKFEIRSQTPTNIRPIRYITKCKILMLQITCKSILNTNKRRLVESKRFRDINHCDEILRIVAYIKKHQTGQYLKSVQRNQKKLLNNSDNY